MGCEERELNAVYREREDGRVAPVMVDNGPVHEVVLTGRRRRFVQPACPQAQRAGRRPPTSPAARRLPAIWKPASAISACTATSCTAKNKTGHPYGGNQPRQLDLQQVLSKEYPHAHLHHHRAPPRLLSRMPELRARGRGRVRRRRRADGRTAGAGAVRDQRPAGPRLCGDRAGRLYSARRTANRSAVWGIYDVLRRPRIPIRSLRSRR